MSFHWANSVVVVTGGSAGIGEQVVRLLMEEHVKHLAILDIAEQTGTALQDELNSKYGDIVKFILCDVTDDNQLFAAYNSVTADKGYIDVVINNAGMCNDSLPMYKKEIQLNLTALVSSTIKCLELMRKDEGSRGGTVINIASMAGVYKVPEMAIYCSTKAAVLHFTNCIGDKEFYSRTGVRIYSMALGATATTLFTPENMGHFDKGLEDRLKNVVDVHPPQRIESAARGIVEAYKHAASASVWLSHKNQPVRDITECFDQSYDIFQKLVTYTNEDREAVKHE